MPRARNSEFRAYPWIEQRLAERDWNTRNPNRQASGEVWTQGECLENDEIRRGLGEQKPENVARISDASVWVIEAKEGQQRIVQALAEAKAYADAITTGSSLLAAPFATGVAGNDEEGYLVRTEYREGGGSWRPVVMGANPVTRLLSKHELLRILAADNADLDFAPLTVREVVDLASYINRRLHVAKIEKDHRAVVVAVLLLALESDLGLSLTQGASRVFIDDINARARRIFDAAGRQELWDTLKIRPSNETLDDQAAALSDVIIKLRNADILHAVRTADVLGSFFENFLRYGNTSKDLGIVLTPRHICWLATEVLNVSTSDIVYDPAAGTGGFLIAAFNRAKEQVTATQATNFAKTRLYGAEVSGKVAALAFINMYFRGDGKHNLKIDSSLRYRLASDAQAQRLTFHEGQERPRGEGPKVTKVLMNPPFGLKSSSEKEPHFVNHALAQLETNGLLFSVLPASVMYDREWKAWRETLLHSNQLLAVVAFPIDIFYPVATESIGIFVKKGVAHNAGQDVLWARIADDGFVKRKGFRVERRGVDYKLVMAPLVDTLRAWVSYGNRLAARPGEYEYAPISSDELIPHSHLGTAALEPAEFEGEVRRIFKSMVTQLWDQEQRAEPVVDDVEL